MKNMLRRDLLKGILGLVGGGLLLNKVQGQDSSTSSSDSMSESSKCNAFGIHTIDCCQNEFRMECQEEVKPGDKLYFHDFGRILKEPNENFLGVVLDNKDEWGCCKVVLYLK